MPSRPASTKPSPSPASSRGKATPTAKPASAGKATPRPKSPASARKTTQRTSRSKSPAPPRKSSASEQKVAKESTVKSIDTNVDPLSSTERKKSDDRARLALILAVIVPWVLAPLFQVSFAGFVDSLAIKTPIQVKNPIRFLALVALLSTPHVFYAWVWTHSADWSRICNSRGLEPFKAFASCAHLLKGVQVAAIAWWIWPLLGDPRTLVYGIHPLKAVLVLQLFAIGQLLNVQVYQKIGESGVYYGTRLGIDVPWVHGFPFSVVPHPQYFGATLSFWAVFLLLANEKTASEGIYYLCIIMAFYYAFSSYTESHW